MNLYLENLGNGKHAIRCPWSHEHTTMSTRTSTIIEDGTGPSGRFGFNCFHGHCVERDLGDLIAFLRNKGVDVSKYMGKSVDRGNNSSDENNRKMTVESMETFYSGQEEVIEWIIDGLIAKGSTSFLVAQPKVGKSELTRDLTACVAQGTSFLGRDCKKGSVLLIPLEEHRAVMKEKFRKRGVAGTDPVSIVKSINRDTAVEDLEKLIVELNPAIVIIDTFQRFVQSGDLNDYSSVYNSCIPFNSLARKHGCHILFTHHANKYGGSGQTGILGSTGLAGSVDMLMYIQKNEGGKRIFHNEPRYGVSIPRTELVLDENSGRFSLGKTADQDSLDEVLKDLKDYFINSPDSKFQISDLKKEFECKAQTLSKALRNLSDAGVLMKTGEGKKGSPLVYQLAYDGYQPWDAPTN